MDKLLRKLTNRVFQINDKLITLNFEYLGQLSLISQMIEQNLIMRIDLYHKEHGIKCKRLDDQPLGILILEFEKISTKDIVSIKKITLLKRINKYRKIFTHHTLELYKKNPSSYEDFIIKLFLSRKYKTDSANYLKAVKKWMKIEHIM